MTTNTNPAKIIDRVRKMLALAERAGTPEEAGTAFAMAQKIIAENALSMEQVRQAQLKADATRPANEPIIKRIVYTFKSSQTQTWIGILASAIHEVNGCSPIYARLVGPAAREGGAKQGVDEVKAIEGWGRASDLELVEELMRVVVGQIETLTTGCGFTGRTALNNFRLGATQVVCQRLRSAAADARKAIAAAADAETNVAARECTSLALRSLDDRKAVAKRTMEQAYGGKIGKSSSSSSRADYAARAAGQRAGGTVNLSRTAQIA